TLPDVDVTLVGDSNAQTITGIKTFSTAPIFNTALAITSGGTGGADATTARTNLGLSYALSATLATNNHIAAWGDSLTEAAYPLDLTNLSNIPVYNGGIGGQTSTQIRDRMLAATDKYSWPTIIWAGRNNVTDPTQIKADIASMVAALTTTHYLVLGVLNNSAEPSGSANYNTIVQLNSDLAATYGSRFIDMRTYLVSLYNPSLPQDVIDHNNDIPPSSLRSDTVHLTLAGYQIVAQKIYDNIAILMEQTGGGLITSANAPTLFFNRPVIDVANAGSYTIGGLQALYIPDQTALNGSIIFGNGGRKMVHTTGSEGMFNTFAGIGSGVLTSSGYSNSALGFLSMYSNTTGFANTSMGTNSMFSNTTGANNVGIGGSALYTNSTGVSNTAVGIGALRNNTVNNNTALGFNAGFSNSTGDSITAIGYGALTNNTTGASNTVLGSNALATNITGSNNTGVGTSALFSSTGSGNTAVGSTALRNNTANNNTAVGFTAAYSNIGGINLTAIGYAALYSNTTGNNNTAFGLNASQGNISGGSNVAIGPNALRYNTTGGQNIAIGYEAGAGVSTASNISNNILVGYHAGLALLTGGNGNVLIGFQAGQSLTTGAGNIVLGNNVDAQSITASNTLNIGNAIFGTTINGTGTTISGGNIGLFVIAPSARLQLPAGTITASTAPLKFTSGTSLTTAETGAMEYDGTSLYFTPVATRYNLVMNNLGVSGGQTIIGGTGAGENLTLASTSSATKGKIIFGVSGTSAYDGATGFLGIGTTSPSALLSLSGNISAAAWTTAGINLKTAAATYTDTSSSGTVAVTAVNALAVPTLTSSSATTYTTAATLYIAGAPTASTNVTISNGLALYVNAGIAGFNGGISTGNGFLGSNVNFAAGGGTGTTRSSTAGIQFGGSTVSAYRAGLNGGTSTTLTAADNYSNLIVGSSPITTAATGTHAILSNAVVNPIGTISAGGATIGNTASLYVAGAASATVTGNNYAFWVASGLSQFGSASVTTGTTVATFQNAGGTCNVIPSTAGGVSCSSDMNLKKNIINIGDNSAWSFNTNVSPASQSTLDKILALAPVNYNWNVEQSSDSKHAGFIAQEVQQVFPDLVSTDPVTHLLSLNYAGMMPYVVEAIKEMNVKIAVLPTYDDPTIVSSLNTFLKNIAEHGLGIFSKVKTTELCVDDICVTRDQFKQMVQGNGSTTVTNSSSSSLYIEPVVEHTSANSSSEGVSQTPSVTPVEVVVPISDPDTVQIPE
ncbi:MAG: tail fiber domain-containing protein, partial [Candidatus Paceibacterota bacterium]